MSIIGDYTPQQMRNLIIKFYPGSYTPQTFGNVILNWEATRYNFNFTESGYNPIVYDFNFGPEFDIGVQIIIDNEWKNISTVQVALNGVWKEVSEVQIIKNGEWKLLTS